MVILLVEGAVGTVAVAEAVAETAGAVEAIRAEGFVPVLLNEWPLNDEDPRSDQDPRSDKDSLKRSSWAEILRVKILRVDILRVASSE